MVHFALCISVFRPSIASRCPARAVLFRRAGVLPIVGWSLWRRGPAAHGAVGGDVNVPRAMGPRDSRRRTRTAVSTAVLRRGPGGAADPYDAGIAVRGAWAPERRSSRIR